MKNILDRIIELKGTQNTAAFGRSIGLNQQTMDRYLKGREPPIGVIRQLCIVYGVSADWLLGLSDGNERGTSVHAPNNSGAIAVGKNARATSSQRAQPSQPSQHPDCLNCKYKRLADAFKAL